MLIIEISIGVFIALIAFKFLEVINKNNKLKKLKNEEMALFAQNYIKGMDERSEESFARYLEVFLGRMLTLKDDKTITFQDAAMIELNIFMTQCSELAKELNSKEQENIKFLELDEFYKKIIEDKIGIIISTKDNTAQRSAIKIMEDKLIQLANQI